MALLQGRDRCAALSRAPVGRRGGRSIVRVVRKSIQALTVREFCLYRAICHELDALAEELETQPLATGDWLNLATALRDRRLLVGWLRELGLPPSSLYGRHGINEAMEERLLIDGEPDR